MKTVFLIFTLLSATLNARADFSYTTTRKGIAGGGSQPSKYYFKDQKMKMDSGNVATILDFAAQTVTTLNHNDKTISIRSFNDQASTAKPGDLNMKIDVRETGQKKIINGYNASELIMTMDVDSPEMRQAGGKMRMEMDMWLSADVPGAGELRAFYQKNGNRFPWTAVAGGGNQGMQEGMAELQRKISEMNGIPVLEVVKIKPASGTAAPAMPQMTAAQSAKMQSAMAQLEALQKQGGPAGAAAAQAMARMGSMPGAAGNSVPGASDSLFEITMESTDFSTASVPDSAFAIPADYRKADAKR